MYVRQVNTVNIYQVMHNYVAASIKNPFKPITGDSSFAGTLCVNGIDCILLIVADGVSGAPKDWLASRSVIHFMLEYFQNSDSTISQALLDAVYIANRNLLFGVDNTYGMLSALSAVLYVPSLSKLWCVNIGDTRIFGIKDNTFTQLTKDDSKRIPYKVNGKIILQNGLPVMKTYLTRAIGMTSELSLQTMEFHESVYDALLLASDGFYELPAFERYASWLIAEPDMSQISQNIQRVLPDEISDDASFAVIRFVPLLNTDLRSIIEQGNFSDISRMAILTLLEDNLKKAVLQQDNIYLDKILLFIEEQKIAYNKTKMIELLDLMIENNIPYVQRMSAIIRRL